jgi:SAM-dependent methyltransferase
MSDACPIDERASRPRKRLKTVSQQWRLHHPSYVKLQSGDRVFVRPEVVVEKGFIAKLLKNDDSSSKRCSVQIESTNETILVKRKRLLPIYSNNNYDQLILITEKTNQYRQLAVSQVLSSDHVFEIGCSTGETSKLLWLYAETWVGIDNSDDMVLETLHKLVTHLSTTATTCQTNCLHIDALLQPDNAKTAASQFHEPTCVFLDIGGDRDLAAVVQLVTWTLKEFLNLRMVVVKSERLFQTLSPDEHGVVQDGARWLQTTAQATHSLVPNHPLQAGLVRNANGVPICRYHNYHVQGCRKGLACPYNHSHCHACLLHGHVARLCPAIKQPEDG